MKPIGILSLSLLMGLAAGSASAQEIQNLVRVDAANKSASPAVTRSIANYIAARNSAAVVQAMARTRSDTAPTMTVEALLVAIESNARIVEPAAPAAQPTPAAVTPPPEEPPPPAKKKIVKRGGRGSSGGGGGGW